MQKCPVQLRHCCPNTPIYADFEELEREEINTQEAIKALLNIPNKLKNNGIDINNFNNLSELQKMYFAFQCFHPMNYIAIKTYESKNRDIIRFRVISESIKDNIATLKTEGIFIGKEIYEVKLEEVDNQWFIIDEKFTNPYQFE